MKLRAIASGIAGLFFVISAFAADLPKGTEVNLVFRQDLSSRSARAGQSVQLAVKDDVVDPNGAVILHAGEPVTATIERVDKNDHFGKNARIRIAISPIHGVYLEPRDKGKNIGGTRTDEAAAASGGAALVFGPLGLVGGYFVVGHSVHIHRGDSLRTEVSGDAAHH